MSKPKPFENFGKYLISGIHRAAHEQELSSGEMHKRLANAVGVADTTLYGWRRGEHIPDPEIIEKIARLLVNTRAVNQEWLSNFLSAARFGPQEAVDALQEGLFGQEWQLDVSHPQAQNDLSNRINKPEDSMITPTRLRYDHIPAPRLVVGRETALYHLKSRLGVVQDDQEQSKTNTLVIRGWPGVGKTTLMQMFANDPEVHAHFTDGILWISLGENPNILANISSWAIAFGCQSQNDSLSVEELTNRLTAVLRHKRVLVIIDDVWQTEHAIPFQVGGPDCATLITTRLPEVAQALTLVPNTVYILPVLTDEAALDLLQVLIPDIVKEYPDASNDLVKDLEGLPLAINIAGRLLNAEAQLGWGILDLLESLREGTKLLEAQAPADRIDYATQTIPTVAVLLAKSTDRLDEDTRNCFACLGVFAPKPATFDLDSMKVVWEVDDPKPIVRALVDRGLLEPINKRFQMHALLVAHAKSMLVP